MKRSIDGGKIREHKAQVDTAEAPRQLVLEREQNALAAQAKLEREFQEYKAIAIKVAGTSETQVAAIDKIDAALVEVRTANTALSAAIHVSLVQSQKVSPASTNDKNAAPDPINKTNWWMIAGVIFTLAVVVLFTFRPAPPVAPIPPVALIIPPVALKEEDLANRTEQQLIDSLPENYKTALVRLQQGFRRSAAISIKTQAEAVTPQPNPNIVATIDAIIKKEEHSVPYLNSQGNGYLANKQYDLAIQKFDEAISLGDTKSYESRGMAWLAKLEYERAIADFTQALKSEHENYLAYVHRAEANEKKGDRDSAIADYRRALALAPDKTISDQINAALKPLNPPVQPEVATPPPGRRAAVTQSRLPQCPSDAIWSNCEGTLSSPNGDKYVGEFQYNKRSGQGTLTWANGGKYVGGFSNDVLSGQGTLTLGDGRKYVGGFSNGKMNGQGTMFAPDGSILVSGIWENDKVVETNTVNARPRARRGR